MKGSMQQAGKSIEELILVTYLLTEVIISGFCSHYHFLTLCLSIYFANIKSTLETLLFCGHFFNNHVYIDMYG